MENRFGIKDFFLFALLLVVIVLIILGMVQVDRQWTSIKALEEASREQGRDLVEIRRTLAEGISVSNSGSGPTSAPAGSIDPFKPLAEAQKLPGFARGDWLVDNLNANLKAMTPLIGNDIPAAWIQAKVLESLMYRDVDSLDFVPLLAKSWDISPDGKTITFHLRKGITFSDGAPFTADDVIFTFDWVLNPQVNAPRDRSYLELLKSYRKIDDYTVEFNFKEFYFKSLETIGGEPILAKHFYSKYTPEQFNETPGLIIGTGPYRMEDPAGWNPGKPIVLYRNERYWGTPPPPDRLVYLEVQEETANQTMFTNGEMDLFSATKEQYVKMKDDPNVLKTARPMEYVNLLGGYSFIGWNESINQKPSVFADKRVRKAMTMLIDREAIAKDVFLGYAQPASGSFAPASKQHDPSVKPLPYDPEGAKKLLAEAGIYDRDGDGVLDTPDGKPFRFKLTFGNKLAIYDRITLFMKDGFAKAGIIMDRDPEEWPVMQQKLDRRDFESIMMAWSGAVDDDPNQIFASSQIKDQGDNFVSYNSPEADAAIQAARVCVDPAQRLELWHKVDRILADECPYTFLLNVKSTIFINKRWQNIRLSTMGLNYNHLDCSPLPWFVPKDQQKYTTK